MYSTGIIKKSAWRRSLWIGWPLLSIGLLSWIAFFWIAYRARQRKWFLWGLLYSFPFLMSVSSEVINYPSPLAGLVIISTWITSSIHAFIARKEYLIRLEAIDLLKSQEEMKLRNQVLREYGLVNQPQSSGTSASFAQPPIRLAGPGTGPVVTGQASIIAGQISPTSPHQPRQPLIYINRASEAAIASLPGIGPILAKKAVAERERRGGFRSVEDFGEALGLKPHIVERLRPLVVITPVEEQEATAGARLVDF